MIAFGVCAGPSERFDTVAKPSLDALAPGCPVFVVRDQTSIFEAYNELIRQALAADGVEALVLIHDDVELTDPEWERELRAAMLAGADVVGVIGGRGPGGMAWFDRAEMIGHVVEPTRVESRGGVRDGEVDVLDGVLLAVSRRFMETCRLPEGVYPGFHGYDAELCMLARAAGMSVRVAPIDIVHHTSGAFGSRSSYLDWMRCRFIWQLRWKQGSVASRAVSRVRLAALPVEVRLRPSVRRRANALRR